MFVRVNIDREKCLGIEKSGRCVEVCPVNVFGAHGGSPVVVSENEDECTLCNLCLERCPSRAISIEKKYEK